MTTERSSGTDVILTGLPRSGTTLTCFLLNQLPNSVALHEPISPGSLQAATPEGIIGKISTFFATQRVMIRTTARATSKSRGERVPRNHVSDAVGGKLQTELLDGSSILVDNVSSDDFSLYIKQPSAFSALLPVLVGHFPCYALIRNPLAVLLSWQDARMNISQGYAPNAERFAPDLKHALTVEKDRLERQLILMDFFFGRYLDHVPERTIRYESIVASGGKALSLIDPAAESLSEPLSSRNRRATDDNPMARRLAERLLERDSPCWHFYSRRDVESLLE